MTSKQKLSRILGVTGWSRDHLADLLGVNNATLTRWTKGRGKMREVAQGKIDMIYDGAVKPLECEMDRLADEVEKKILKGQIKDLEKDDCVA